ncbi:hypothetical protein KAFR_0F01310 [Kazachstania africana CBS 2517]|uniref:CBS domain-containing protein n=1 Tax=Kazachstania africana (strain ATCC 22294 / BCRC 22015 / CBS 2517 / CECT 1963 / NBRC 1671 / NRRL Y-8276) TaxID=1071382 RepID=H2AWH7_KAZAF|nr:hypothetical protein KAFR_0F01310 [Kazachstania africana CBS 2517]CCF58727.1 hypothetical protein KAFR_0F01310 [Kazachstania africana CBS 2517]
MSERSSSPQDINSSKFATEVIPEIKNFSKFTTIDRLSEEDSPVVLFEEDGRSFLTSKFQFYSTIWERSRTFITLTSVAILIGCIAGFIQIFTETLVNWKTGYCARNWLLNKSFCCANIPESLDKRSLLFDKRDELQCLDEGLWVNWNGHILPFFMFFSLSIIFTSISTLLVKFVAPMATGSGISEIKTWVSGFEHLPEFLNSPTLIVKSIALPLTIASGLAVGKEGPSVHYATCCGYIVTKWLLKGELTYSSQFEYLTAASGAGVAVAFGAPIGGVLFGLEEISSSNSFNGSMLWKSYYVALIAVTTLKCINPFRNGKIILFNVTYDKNWKVLEIPVFILLGIFGGFYGQFVSKWNISYVHFRKKYLSSWPIQEVLVLTVMTALISYFNEFLRLDMTESMGILFHECTTNDNSSSFQHRLCLLDENTHVISFLRVFSSLSFATVIRMLLVIISYGAMIPAGIFVPSMAIGATFGRAISLLVERFICGPGVITPGAYAFLGAAATLTGITNLTLTVVVIMLELTGAFIYIIPTMIVVAITRVLLNSNHVDGIADQMILVNGFPYLDRAEDKYDDFMDKHTAEEIMETNMITLRETMYFSELEDLVYNVSGKDVSGFPIIKDGDENEPEKRCIGYILKHRLVKRLTAQSLPTTDSRRTIVHFSKKEYYNSDDEIDLSGITIISPVTAKIDTSASTLFCTFQRMGCKTIIIEKDGFLQGLITSKDIIKFERIKAREIYGPRYEYNEKLNEKVWSYLEYLTKLFA